MLAGGLVKSNQAFGFIPTRRKVEEHSASDRHLSLTIPTPFSLLNTRNPDRHVNTVVETHAHRKTHKSANSDRHTQDTRTCIKTVCIDSCSEKNPDIASLRTHSHIHTLQA